MLEYTQSTDKYIIYYLVPIYKYILIFLIYLWYSWYSSYLMTAEVVHGNF